MAGTRPCERRVITCPSSTRRSCWPRTREPAAPVHEARPILPPIATLVRAAEQPVRHDTGRPERVREGLEVDPGLAPRTILSCRHPRDRSGRGRPARPVLAVSRPCRRAYVARRHLEFAQPTLPAVATPRTLSFSPPHHSPSSQPPPFLRSLVTALRIETVLPRSAPESLPHDEHTYCTKEPLAFACSSDVLLTSALNSSWRITCPAVAARGSRRAQSAGSERNQARAQSRFEHADRSGQARANTRQIYFFSVPIDALLGLGISRRADFGTHPVRIEGVGRLKEVPAPISRGHRWPAHLPVQEGGGDRGDGDAEADRRVGL